MRESKGRFQEIDLEFTLAVAIIALLPRLFVAIAWAREPTWDGHYYHFYAERLADGFGYSEDAVVAGRTVWKAACHYPVGYSFLLSFFYRVFGSSLVVAPIVNALIGTLTVVVVHRLARRCLDPTRARVAAVLAALHPGLIAYSAVVMTEPLAALLLLSAALVFARSFPRAVAIVIVGVLLGFATLVRPSVLLAAPLLLLFPTRPTFESAARIAAITVLAIVVVLPWTIRNCVRMDGCAFVSTNGGWNLAIGALTHSGRFESLDGKGCPIVKGQVEQDRCWATLGRRAILDSPGRWLGLIPKKLGHTYDHESFAIEYLREANPVAWPENRRAAGRELLTFFHRLLLIVAVLGTLARPKFRELFEFARSKFVTAPSRETVASTLALLAVGIVVLYAIAAIHHPFFWLAVLIPIIPLLPLPGRVVQGPVGRYLLALVALTSFTHAIFFGDDRYHLVVTPVLCILAAGALRRPEESPVVE